MFFTALLFLVCCKSETGKTPGITTEKPPSPLFISLPESATNIGFTNTLNEGLNTNVLMYEYFYNGGGVAIGDVNNDGLDDIYFSANMVSNRLYLNKGKMKFADVTAQAGVAGRDGPWKTGVTMADVNADGLLDIFVCYSGNVQPGRRRKQLFINQGADSTGIPHFTDEAARYGLDNTSTATGAVFFDFDKDGDLDMFSLNHNPQNIPVLDEASTAALLNKPNEVTGSKLYENRNGKFVDVTAKTGINSSALSYGLGAGVADINQDGWPDIYLSNDYGVPDYLYINNRNGTFSNQLQKSLGHTSHFSMGNDIADVNNDALPDIFTLDMLPEDNRRQKLLFAPDNYEKFDLALRSGYYYQYMRNMLHINNGNGTFSETGQLSGLSNTDWSWAPLFADFDNDGWKDLYVTNGYLHDFNNMDFMKYMGDYLQNRKLMRQDILQLVQKMPSSNVTNYMFKNNGGLLFSDTGLNWGLSETSNSNGAAYADLDNDGDLDLVVNNINRPAFVYQNQRNTLPGHYYLSVKLNGAGKNRQGIGARVTLYQNGEKQYAEQMPARGYQSSVSPVMHFGFRQNKPADSLLVVWPSGKKQLLKNVENNQAITLNEKEAVSGYYPPKPAQVLFTEVSAPLSYTQLENKLNDFKRQPLLVSPLSFSGPCMIKADINGDAIEDVFVGGASGQAASLFFGTKGGKFIKSDQPAFEIDKQHEDASAGFFDANGDGFTDLYVASGGYGNLMPDDPLLQDRLYLNNGKGKFGKVAALPPMQSSKSCVRAADVNNDGHLDLFVGGRVIPGRYPETPKSYILINTGDGKFTDQTAAVAPQLATIGMVTDAVWVDMNGDKRLDLMLAGEWMPLTVLINTNGKLENRTTAYFDQEYSGWWNSLLIDDLNNDGRPDVLAGNHGLNSQCRATPQQPAELFYKDFDGNGSVDPILCMYIQDQSYPYVTRDELLDQMSIMRTRFPDYKSYADARLTDIFTGDELKGAGHLKATHLETALFLSDKSGKLHQEALPPQAQFAPVHAMLAVDYNKDGAKDLLLCGNSNKARLRFGKYDANYGVLLENKGSGKFDYIPQATSGFKLKGDVRSAISLGNTLLFGINQQAVRAYKLIK